MNQRRSMQNGPRFGGQQGGMQIQSTPQPGLPPPNAHPPGFGQGFQQAQPFYGANPSPSIFIPSPANITIDPKPSAPPVPLSQPLNPVPSDMNAGMNQGGYNSYNPSGISAETGDTAYTAMQSMRDVRGSIGSDGVVPGRITDTEIRMKINGDLPLWYTQERPKMAKYSKHMLHIFGTGVCVLVGKTHAYFLKVLEAEMGDTPKHVKVMYSQCLFMRIGDSDKDESDKPKIKNIKGGRFGQPEDSALTFYSWNEGESLFKTGDRGETHVLLDHFTHLKKQPNRCMCGNQNTPCKCINEAKRLVLEDPSAYQQFSGTTGKCF